MSDIRLIDANAMYKRFCVEKKGLDGIYDSTDLPDMLGGMPTIDAIPVEWLRGLMIEYANINTQEHAAYAYCLNNVIEEWQKEQEAQDGKNRKMGEDER